MDGIADHVSGALLAFGAAGHQRSIPNLRTICPSASTLIRFAPFGAVAFMASVEASSKVLTDRRRNSSFLVSLPTPCQPLGKLLRTHSFCAPLLLRTNIPQSDLGCARAKFKLSHYHNSLLPLSATFGLDHFEGQSWLGLHRHLPMTIIAYAFLQNHRFAKERREKASIGRRLNQVCQRCVTPSPISCFDGRLSDVRPAENRSDRDNSVNDRPKWC